MKQLLEKREKILREQIVETEWKMFQNTQNVGGRASCQDDYSTFYHMRMAQFDLWDDETATSYLEDLKEAEDKGRNLIAEKYLHMMQSTYPEEYENQKHFLPYISEEKSNLAKEICNEMICQTVELHKKYPYVGKNGRPIRSTSDQCGITSIETYQYGEMLTYSEKTLQLLKKHLFVLQEAGISFAKEVTSRSICSYGFSSLDEAELFLEEKDRR